MDYEIEFSTCETDRRTAPRVPVGSVSTPPLGRKGTQIEMWSVVKGTPGNVSHMTPELAGRPSPALKYGWISVRAILATSGGVRLGQWEGQGDAVGDWNCGPFFNRMEGS
jgi:hypothetical protein